MTTKYFFVILSFVGCAFATAEISSSYALLEKHSSFNPGLKTEPVQAPPIFKQDVPEGDHAHTHPVFKPEEHHQARIRIVDNGEDIAKHGMLADQPTKQVDEISRIDNLLTPNYGYGPGPAEVAYPDVPYAPGYGYDQSYSSSNEYDPYGNGLSTFLEPDTSAFSLLWSQVPGPRAIVGFVGRTLAWFLSSIPLLIVGYVITAGVCTYTDLCNNAFNREQMRSLVSSESLIKISNAAEMVKSAIDKYQKIQNVSNDNKMRR